MSLTLGDIVHEVVVDSKESKRLAAMVGKGWNLLLNELNPDNPRNKAGIELLPPVMDICDGGDRIMHFLASERGGVFMRLPEVKDPDFCRKQFMAAMAELGALVRSFEHALDEGGPRGEKVGPGELRQFEAQAQAAMTGLQMAVAACRMELLQSKEG